MALNKFRASFEATSFETRLSMLAVAAGLVNIWFGLLVGFVAVWRFATSENIQLQQRLALWFFAPTVVALVFLSRGLSLPSDDLLRHIGAGAIGFDYRAQYPWSDLPAANLWLGFDWVLWKLQGFGVSKEILLKWVPGLFIALQSLVLYAALRRAVPAHRTNAPLFLLAGSLGLLLITPRSLLGRPEMFILIFAAAAWIPRSAAGVSAWVAGFLLLTPGYWLGWAYAPFALLLWPQRLSLRLRLGLTAGLALAHLGFWQLYTGDYLGLMVWLKGTLGVKAFENEQLLGLFTFWGWWVFFLVVALAGSMMTRRRLKASAGVILLFIWLALPNQVRYGPALAFVALPWLYKLFTAVHIARPFPLPPAAVILVLAWTAAQVVPSEQPVPKFKLQASARVYSESPYATVFYGQPGIAVEPSFALGASKAPWGKLKDALKDDEHCRLLQEGGFTHLVEKSRKTVVPCAQLQQVDGPWRLWELK